jgi:peptidoglycan/xylan/chitin deacetylase (PgdA/CDA1 family)
MVSICKSSYFEVADLSGLNAANLDTLQNSVAVLAYHGVISDDYSDHPLRSSNMVTVTEFQRHLTEIVRLFDPISLDDFRAWFRGGRKLPRRAALVTFDDGYANNLVYAAPLLKQMGVPAIFFIPTGYVGNERLLWPTEVCCRSYYWPRERMPLPRGEEVILPQSHSARIAFADALERTCKRLPVAACMEYLARLRAEHELVLDGAARELFGFLDWDGVRELRKHGFDVGSHTVEHVIVSRVDHAQLVHELRASKATIENEIHSDCSCFAYPDGNTDDITPAAMRAAAGAGYDVAFCVMDGICRRFANPMALDRIWIPGRISIREFRTRVSGTHGKFKRLLRHSASARFLTSSNVL